MLSNLQKRKSEGFTIIEVMIVLAIAGLIMLIVFLAVPALQRNSRNTQYRNDAASIIAAANEFTNNNNGTSPANGASTVATSDAAKILSLAKTKSITNLTIASTGTSLTPTFATAFMNVGYKCGTANGSSYNISTSSGRALVLVYAVEDSSGGVVAQCTES